MGFKPAKAAREVSLRADLKCGWAMGQLGSKKYRLIAEHRAYVTDIEMSFANAAVQFASQEDILFMKCHSCEPNMELSRTHAGAWWCLCVKAAI
jgi:hypothetical protein